MNKLEIRWYDVKDTVKTVLIITYVILCMFTGAFSATSKGCVESYRESKQVDEKTLTITDVDRPCEAATKVVKGIGAAVITPIYWAVYFAEKVHGQT